jgi:hypothetical protein
MKTSWERKTETNIEGISVYPKARKNGVSKVIVFSDVIGDPFGGGGGLSNSGTDFLKGKLWNHIRTYHDEETLEEVLATVYAYSDERQKMLSSELEIWLQQRYNYHLMRIRENKKGTNIH